MRGSFNLWAYLHSHLHWSRKTFGPGPRTKGITDHIRKELAEIAAFADHQVVVTRVTRGGIEFTPSTALRLQFGDVFL
mgnify:CR=1 FL=1